MAQRIGLVLAGGSGRRMGRTKGDLIFEGTTLATRAARALWPMCGSVFISVARDRPNPAPGFPTVEDEPPAGRGPLAGIAAGFRATGSADLVVLACDYPRVVSDLLAALAAGGADHDVVIPTDPGGRDHPLVGLWRRSAEDSVRRALEEGAREVRGVLRDLRVRRLAAADLPDLDWAQALGNWNVPGDVGG